MRQPNLYQYARQFIFIVYVVAVSKFFMLLLLPFYCDCSFRYFYAIFIISMFDLSNSSLFFFGNLHPSIFALRVNVAHTWNILVGFVTFPGEADHRSVFSSRSGSKILLLFIYSFFFQKLLMLIFFKFKIHL
jgi:hypothetical protein